MSSSVSDLDEAIRSYHVYDLSEYRLVNELCHHIPNANAESYLPSLRFKIASTSFISRNLIPDKHKPYWDMCTDLTGMIPNTTFCNTIGISRQAMFRRVDAGSYFKTSHIHGTTFIIPSDSRFFDMWDAGKVVVAIMAQDPYIQTECGDTIDCFEIDGYRYAQY